MLFLLQEGPANTNAYAIAGYIVIFGVLAIYVISLVVRNRNLKNDLEVLEDVEERRS